MPNRRAADGRKTTLDQRPRDIIRIAALWPLCRYRHKTHSTGHASRLARETLANYGRSKDIRAAEELIAEIGAAMLCAQLGMEPTEREDHAAYVASWLTALRNDKRAIFRAASAAQAASELILSHMMAPDVARAA